MNCSKWALTLAELDASDLIRLVSHSVRASSWRTGPPDTLSEREKTQRAAACNGLRIMAPQDMWHVWDLLHVSVCALCVCAQMDLLWLCKTLCVWVCVSVLTVCTSAQMHMIIGNLYISMCVFSLFIIGYHMCTHAFVWICIFVFVYICLPYRCTVNR